ncbi:carbamoyltransferase HypF [Antrihabitans cavernicola]|uniref:Carbamoyltransferase n=1 Tax=Antrihabitans cavernicola TaxID=2495913 RepID=A0A5A7SCH3_9NOCA|nr:carbamoyltransferase HypF [Spelaeibacter cavernicola]KAA0022195.1 carbamoyltransferase HypF [Spelaeibacter cavernicola]
MGADGGPALTTDAARIHQPSDTVVTSIDSTRRDRIIVRGIVQGVGFRPFVARLASELDLSGFCGNDDSSVFIEVEGRQADLDLFAQRVRSDAPSMSVIVDLTAEPMPAQGTNDFRIVESVHVDGARTLISPDVATCADCLREFGDPSDRRYLHPFVNCTNCGPRFTVITELPYDRPFTTMADFPMCAQCRAEYRDPADRRFHAQPISCHDCGPRIFLEQDGIRIDADVVRHAQRVLREGLILAVKGIGGFHLVCDATNPDAVDRLRERKHRPDKPLAVMAVDVAAARTIATISDREAELLRHPARPIVLLTKKQRCDLAIGIAPGIGELGVLLPYTPLHQLLFRGDTPRLLVMTSGNLSGEPLCFDNDDARVRLASIADAFLMHDRTIAVPCEDSVLAVEAGTDMPIRRSRGFAPLPVALHRRGPVVLAVGAEVKNTFCLVREDFAFCSSHLGDMGTLESQRAFERSVEQLTTLHRVLPELVVADDHPGYSTRQWAQRYCDVNDVPLRTAQHHHAHVASLLAEHDRLDTRVLGIAFDGTGYGCDSSIWGGELLTVGPDILQVERAAHLRSFWLPGGDAAVRNPARVAMALLHEAGVADIDGLPCTDALSDDERVLLASQSSTGVGCVRTTSMGRLFDGVASLLGVRHRVTYEAQAAIELETLAASASSATELAFGDGLDFAPLLRGLVDGVRSGESRAALALGFHLALANATAELASRVVTGTDTIGLTGGVFQNRLLVRLLRAELQAKGFDVLTHRLVPANDGGLSLGQAVLGRAIARRDGIGATS